LRRAREESFLTVSPSLNAVMRGFALNSSSVDNVVQTLFSAAEGSAAAGVEGTTADEEIS
jgi:hypothetical protein